MTDMLSVVARAICLAGDVPADVREGCKVLCSMCLSEAKAAIKAHEKALEAQGLVIVPREPTDKMKMAPRARGQIGPVGATEVWQAMIAALEGKDE